MKTCAITGHRPTRFKWKYQEHYAGCKRLKRRLCEQLVLLYDQGVRTYYVGGALGVDMWAAEILLQMREQPEYSEIDLCLAVPFDGHDRDWDERSKARLHFIQNHAQVVVVGSHPGAENYKKRNYYMVDRADYLLAVYDNDRSIRSGTGMTVNYAKKKGIPIILIHPDTGVVSSATHGTNKE